MEIVQLKAKNDGLQRFVVETDTREKEIGEMKYRSGITENSLKTLQ